MFTRLGKEAGLAALLLLFAFCLPVAAADQAQDVFAVTVPVDATAADATTARDQARADGAQRAFHVLIGRLSRTPDAGKQIHVSPTQLTDLVSGFEVANERSSGVHYMADYTFRFRPSGIRHLLQEAGLSFAETAARPLIVLPVLKDGDRAVLWDDPNPWRAAWGNRSTPLGLVPITVPIGDLPDVAAIDTQAAIHGDDAAIKAISARYKNGDVLVVQGTMKSGPRALDVTATRYSPSGQSNNQTWTISTVAKPGESEIDLMNRSAAETLRQIEEAWKSSNILDPTKSGTLTATVPSSSLADWVAIREHLTGVPAIRSAELVSLGHGQLKLTLHYLGDTNQLRAALRQRSVDLTGSDPDWELHPRGAAAGDPTDTPAPTQTLVPPAPAPKSGPGPGAASSSGTKTAVTSPSASPLRKASDQP